MPPNPLAAIRDYLTGADLKAAPSTSLPVARVSETVAERKTYYQQDIGAAITLGTLVHGPGATDLLQGVYGTDSNSAVYACLTAICTAYVEAPLRVYRAGDEPGQRDLQPTHPLQSLLDHPNPHLTADEIRCWINWAKHADGNAYVRKVRSSAGNVVELWPISPRLIEVRTTDPRDFISAYRYHYAPGHYEDIDPADMLHFRLGINDADHRLGQSPLKRLVAEVATDVEATRFSDALLHNYGVPGLVVTTPPDVTMDEQEAQKLKDRIGTAFGNEHRGNVGVLTNGAAMQSFGFAPEQMDLSAIHRLPEERISAVLRVPAIIAGLGAGLERATYANFREARAMFVEQTILPLYSFDESVLNMALVPEFSSDGRLYVMHDITDMRALQEDETAKYSRLDMGVKTGWIEPDEARADVGLPPRGTAQSAQSSPEKALAEFKQRVSFEDYPALFDAMAQLAMPSFEAELEAYFDRQRKMLKRRILEA